jgi:hypothetical protein
MDNVKGRNHLGDVSVNGRIILKFILRKCGVRLWAGFMWLRVGSSGRVL